MANEQEPESGAASFDDAASSSEGTSADADVGSVKSRSQSMRRYRVYAVAALAAAVFLSVLTVVLVLTLRDYYNLDDEIYGPHVNLNYTTYAGTQLPNGVNRFLGMRYAAPPLGDLRWKSPVDPYKTGLVEPAHEFGSICLGTNNDYPVNGWDEDCLFVNVWTPTNATTDSKLPVWVFIQGGGYVANTNANWNGAEVVQKSGYNIVMVNFNYRVGLWGFLASNKVSQDGDLNVGLLDQRQLLFWVQKYIGQFGGDADHVVIHGASAGAGSVALHLTAYGGRDDGLFIGGVAESVFFPAQPYLSELEWQFDRLSQQVGCNETADEMACLRSLDTVTLQAANAVSPFPGRTGPPMPLFYWTPCVDGDIIKDLPYTMLEKGRFIKVPILFGHDTDEGSVFAANAATSSDFTSFMQDNYPLLSANDTTAILQQYPQQAAVPQHNAWFSTASLAYGEATFTCPAVNILTMFMAAANASQAWAYRYNVQDSGNTAAGIGVPHLFEAAAIFGPDNVGGAPASYYTYNAPIVPVVMDYFISFVRALDPNAHRDGGAPVWQSWGSEGKRIVLQTGNSSMEITPEDQKSRCAFWQSLSAVTEQK